MSDKRHSTLLRRLIAYIIDLLVMTPAMALSLFLHNKWSGMWYGVFFGLGALLLSSAYFIVMNVKYGATVGKKIVRCRVVNAADLGSISVRMAITREAPLIILGSIGILTQEQVFSTTLSIAGAIKWWVVVDDITTLFNARRRAIHDYLAGTVVIRSDQQTKVETR